MKLVFKGLLLHLWLANIDLIPEEMCEGVGGLGRCLQHKYVNIM